MIMILGRVEGSVWGARQSSGLTANRIVEVRPVTLANVGVGTRLTADPDSAHLSDSTLLAVDSLGADVGQLVLVGIGSRVRDLVVGEGVTTKNVVIAIVDEASVEVQ